MFYKYFIKPFLFLFSPEKAHGITLFLFKTMLRMPLSKWLFIKSVKIENSGEVVRFCGLNFQNRIGLAAGFDKNGEYLNEMPALGFGFIELGTVTPRPQTGNDQEPDRERKK